MPNPTSIVTLSDVKPFLNITTVDANRDTKLQEFIDGTQPVIEDLAGIVVPQTFTESHNAGDVSIFLRRLPVMSITTITELRGTTTYTLTAQPVGQAVDNFGYTLENPDTGQVVRRGAASTPTPFGGWWVGGASTERTYGIGKVQVTYQAGRAAVPTNIKLANLELIRHLWQMGQQGNRPLGGVLADDGITSGGPSGFLVPNRVRELLLSSPRPIVLA